MKNLSTKLRAVFFIVIQMFVLQIFAQNNLVLKIQKGHISNIKCADFSPDGKYLVTAGTKKDGNLIIWDIATGREIINKKISDEYINSVKVSPNGKTVLVASDDSLVRIFDINTGKLKRKHNLNGHAYYAEFSPNGKYYLSLTYQKTQVWESKSGKQIAKFSNEDTYSPKSAVFTPNGKQIYVCYSDDEVIVRVFDIKKKKKIKELKLGEEYLYNISFNNKKKVFYSLGRNLRAWDSKTYNEISKTEIKGGKIALSPDKKIYTMTTTWDETIIFDLKSNKKLAEIEPAEFTVFSNDVSVEKNITKYLILTVPKENIAIYNFDIKTHANLWELMIKGDEIKIDKIKTFDGKAENINVIKTGNDNKLIAGGDFYLNLWNFNSMRNTNRFTEHIRQIFEISIDNTSTKFISATAFCEVKLWDINKRASVKSYEWDPYKVIYNLQFSQNGNYVYAGRKDGNSIIWDINKDTIADSFISKYSTFGASIFSSDGKYIVTPSCNSLYLYDIKTHTKVQTFFRPEKEFSKPISTLKFSPDNKTLITYCENEDSLNLWDVKTGKVINYYKPNNILFTFSPDSKSVAIYDNKAIYILDAKTNKLLLQVPVNHNVANFEYSKDQKYIITAGDGIMKVWDLETSKEVVSIVTVMGEGPEFIVYTPDGYYMTSKNGIKAVHFIKNNKVYLFDQFDLKYNRPDIILKRIGYASDDIIKLYKKAYEKRLRKTGFTEKMFNADWHIPEIKIKNSINIAGKTNIQKLKLEILANDSKYKLNRINIWVNDVPMFGINGIDLRNQSTSKFSANYEIILSEGNNKIQVSSLNEKGAESYKQTLFVDYKPEDSQKKDLYFIAIGVSEYNNSAYDLGYAAKDAQDLVDIFKKKNGNYENINTILLLNNNANKKNILKLKETLHKTKVDDQVIVFFAGHGVLDDDFNYYLASTDIDLGNLPETAVSYEEFEDLLDGIPARKKLILIDACHSGEVDNDSEIDEDPELFADNRGVVKFNGKTRNALNSNSTLGLQNSFELMKELFTDLRRSSGAVVISSAAGGEYAYEGGMMKNGKMHRYKKKKNNDKSNNF
ncbi:MAG: hypothetical protein B6I20_10340 [Bacteroidetes bacterium 4572_117]|nr:MAG: hypothetical protein B6I20_10340 [Bacteroidetes bacterium 4572_117]